MKEYVDFEIRVSTVDGSRYTIAAHGPGGDADAPFMSPLGAAAYQTLAARLAGFDVDEAGLIDLGQTLFEALFPGKIRDVYSRTQGMLTPDQGIRLRLVFPTDDTTLAALPWEFIYDPDRGPLALLDTSVLRYLAHSTPIPQLAAPLPLKVLLSAAQTPPAMDVQRELIEVEQALAGLGQHVLITVVPHLTRKALQGRLREGFHIWHFVGHGSMATAGQIGQLHLEDATGDADRISATELNILLHRSGLRLVVLDACEGARLATDPFRSVAPALMRAQVPAVVAMQFSVPQEVTRAFASEFYRTLAEGLPLDACVTEGRRAVMNISGLRNPDWGIPVVYTRAPDGRLFDPAEPMQAAATPPADTLPAPPEPARPPEVSHFVGRAAELAALSEQLTATHAVIITGMSGVGKTSVAAALARQTSDPRKIFWHTFHEGEGLDSLIWNLAGFLAWNGQAEVWQMLQSARQSGGQPPPADLLLDYLLQTLRGQGYVLCFDDFQFVDENPLAELFVERLRTALRVENMALIITSRQMPWAVQSQDVMSLGGLRSGDVHRLLLERAITLDDALVDQLVAITDGNAQLLTLSLSALQKASDPARTIDRLVESEDIERYLLREVDAGLNEAERELMGAVAALLGYGGTRAAIEAALGGTKIRRMLSGLTQRHLLIVSEGEKARKYSQHALVQAFYYGGLSTSERIALHQCAGAYYEREERDILRAAIHYERAGMYAHAAELATADVWALINQGQAKLLCGLLERFDPQQLVPELWGAVRVALGTAYPFAGDIKRAKQVHEETWRFLSGLADSVLVRRLKAQVSAGLGTILQYEAPQAALDWLRQGLDAVEQTDLTAEVAALHIWIGNTLIAMDDYAAAIRAIQQGLALTSEGPSQLHIHALINLGLIAYYQGDLILAKNYMQQALVMSKQLHDSFRMIVVIGNLALFDDVAGHWSAASANYLGAIELSERLGATTQRIRHMQNLGLLSINMGDDEAAITSLTDALDLARANDLREYELVCQFGLADLHLRRGEIDEAVPLLAEVERLALATGSRDRLQEVYRYKAHIHLMHGDTQEGLTIIERALALGREIGKPYDEGLSLRVQGLALLALGRPGDAHDAFERSLALLADDPYESARTQVQWGLALRDGGNIERGIAMLEGARSTFAGLGARRDLAEVAAILEIGDSDSACT